jgi:hypothetical protein
MQPIAFPRRFSAMEHRCGYRRSLEAIVTVRTRSGVTVQGRVLNVSASGALIRGVLQVPLHTQVLVQIEAPGRLAGRISLAGEISRVTPEGFAVEWSEFAPQALRDLVREAALPRRMPGRVSEPDEADLPHRR